MGIAKRRMEDIAMAKVMVDYGKREGEKRFGAGHSRAALAAGGTDVVAGASSDWRELGPLVARLRRAGEARYAGSCAMRPKAKAAVAR